MRISDWSSDVCSSDLRHEIVIVDVDPPRHTASRHIAPGLILEAARRGIGDIVEPAFRPALGMSRCGRNYRGEDEDDQRAQRYAGASKHGGLQTIMIVGGRTEAEIGRASGRERVCQYV